jgi:hypothetical protein
MLWPLFAMLLFLGLVQGAPAGTSANSVSLWNSIIKSAPVEVSSLCKAFLYGNTVSTVTLTKTSTTQKSTTVTLRATKTAAKTVLVTTTSYSSVKKIVTTIVTNGVTVTTTIPYKHFRSH